MPRDKASVRGNGRSGFIGATLVDGLARTGWQVRMLDNLSPWRAEPIVGSGADRIHEASCAPDGVATAAVGNGTFTQLSPFGAVAGSVADRAAKLRQLTGLGGRPGSHIAHCASCGGELARKVAGYERVRMVAGFKLKLLLTHGLRFTSQRFQGWGEAALEKATSGS